MTLKNNRKILYCGPLNDISGYAEAARNYVSALSKLGENIETVHLKIDNFERELSEDEAKLHIKTITNAPEIVRFIMENTKPGDIVINHLIPELSSVIKDRFLISCTSWETDSISKQWVTLLNNMNLCIVSCNENKNAYVRSGVKTPIEFVPLAFDIQKYEKNYIPLDIKEIENIPFKFYTICQLSHKKGFDALLKAYFSEFSGNDDIVLVFKSYIDMRSNINELQAIANIINTIKRNMKLTHFPKICIINDKYSDEEIMRLHATCDAYVMPSRAEGWSITHFEAMAMGKYPIAVGWGGPTEFIRDNEEKGYPKENGILIKYDLQPVVGMNHPTPYLYTSYENWAEPSISDLKKAMRDSYEYMNEEKFIEYQNMIRLKYAEEFSLKNVGVKLLSIINKEYDKWEENRKNALTQQIEAQDLTVCIYAKNEEKNIEKCIKSAIATGGKVILGDNMSIDKTRKIAEKYDIEIVDVPENIFAEEGFAGAYNFVTDKANTKWVLNLLGDCYIANPEMVNVVINSKKSFYYWVKFFMPEKGKNYLEYQSSIHGRLYQKEKAKYFGLAHEDLCDMRKNELIKLEPLIADIHICHQNKQSYVTGPKDKDTVNFDDPKVARKAILTDYLLSKMVFNPELKYFVNDWWFNVYYTENKDRIHKNAKRIRELFPTLKKEEWENRLEFKIV